MRALMMKRCIAGYDFGYPTYIGRSTKKYPFDNYRFLDSGASIYEEERPCPKCRQYRTVKGHDPCIANLPGVNGACCGHGDDDRAYVQRKNGETLRGREALDWIARARFQDLVNLTNEEAFAFTGKRDTCVLTSHALNFVLRELGFTSRLLRIEAAVFPNDKRMCGTILGSQPPSRKAAAPRGMWNGHVGVVIGKTWLLDPTLDQANKDEWPHNTHVGPMVMRLNEQFWRPGGFVLMRTGVTSVRFSLHHRQVGFARAGDARPSHWRPLADQIMHRLKGSVQ
jgi:hypothetical protein